MDTIKGIPSTVKRLPDLIAATHYTITRLGPPSALSRNERAAQEALSALMEEYAGLAQHDAHQHGPERNPND